MGTKPQSRVNQMSCPGMALMWMCSSRNIHTPPSEGCFCFVPPSLPPSPPPEGNSSLASYFSSKSLAFKTPPPPPQEIFDDLLCVWGGGGEGRGCMLQTNMKQIKHNIVKIPPSRSQTSWLFAKRGGVEFGTTKNKSRQIWERGGFEPGTGTARFQVQCPYH